MLYREIIAVFFSDTHNTHKYSMCVCVCVQILQLLNVKLAVHIMNNGL